MLHRRARVQVIAAMAVLAAAVPGRAQTIEDGLMMSKNVLCTGLFYSHDSWDEYWEGTLKRANGNVGKVTTQSVTWMGTYGITNRLNVIAMMPYVWTDATGGPVHGTSGIQDLTVAAKYQVLQTPLTKTGMLNVFAVASAATPIGDYTPDLIPLSIGTQSDRVSGRLTLKFQAQRGWFLEGTGAYTWRGKVTLDRPAYFTDGQQYLSDEVLMPNVFDYRVSAGYANASIYAPFSFTQQITQGGGDIRRQDMPFVSNRMNASRLDGTVQYYLSKPKGLTVKVSGIYAVTGRNVGQSTMVTAGLLYAFKF